MLENIKIARSRVQSERVDAIIIIRSIMLLMAKRYQHIPPGETLRT